MPPSLLIVAPRTSAEAMATALRQTMPDIQVASAGPEALALLRQHRISVTLVAATLPDSGGLPVILQVSKEAPCLLLSHVRSPLQAALAMSYGASGVVSESCGLPLVAEAVHCVAAGWPWFFGVLGESTLPRPKAGPLGPLTHRQLEILDRVSRATGRKAVAHALGMAVYTLDDHLAVLRRRLGADSLADLARRAAGLGLVGSN